MPLLSIPSLAPSISLQPYAYLGIWSKVAGVTITKVCTDCLLERSILGPVHDGSRHRHSWLHEYCFLACKIWSCGEVNYGFWNGLFNGIIYTISWFDWWFNSYVRVWGSSSQTLTQWLLCAVAMWVCSRQPFFNFNEKTTTNSKKKLKNSFSWSFFALCNNLLVWVLWFLQSEVMNKNYKDTCLPELACTNASHAIKGSIAGLGK